MIYIRNTKAFLFLISSFVLLNALHSQEQSSLDKFEPIGSKEILFTENKGQIHNQNYESVLNVLFYGNASGLTYHLKQDGFSFQQIKMDDIESEEYLMNSEKDSTASEITFYRTDISFLDNNQECNVVVGEVAQGFKNYYLANCPSGITNVKSYKSITYQDIYDGIDLRWYGNGQSLEYDFILAPFADYHQIHLKIDGANSIFVDSKGSLNIITPLGSIVQEAPRVFQSGQLLSSRWVLYDDVVSFEIENPNPQIAMVIDPIVRQWGTYFGGTKSDIGTSVVESGNHVIIAGATGSTSLIATTGSHQTTMGGVSDAFLSKFSDSGALVWSTYYGGSDIEYARSCVTDGNSIYLAGTTESITAISTLGSHQIIFGGGYRDGFLANFSFNNGSLTWATYYGGNSNDNILSCALSGSNIFITGITNSNSGISTNGSHKVAKSNGPTDAFLAKFNSSGQRLWGTYYGGSGEDIAHSCATIGNDIFMVGTTKSLSGISTSGAYQTSMASTNYWIGDAFVVKFNTNGIRQWGTYFGGSETEQAHSCVTDGSNIYLMGFTESDSGIATSGAHQSNYGGNKDLFIVKMSSSGALQWSTYYGGSEEEHPGFHISQSISYKNNRLAVASRTQSSNSIATTDGFQTNYAGGYTDGLLVIFNTDGVRQWGTYYGGSGADGASAVSVDDYNLYITGYTSSSSGISTPGAYQVNLNNEDAFLVKFSLPCESADTIEATACLSYQSPSGKYTWNASGIYYDTLLNNLGCDSVIQVNLTVFNTLSPINLGSDTTICIGETLLIDAGLAGLDYLWNNHSTNRYLQVDKPGEYWVRVSNPCGTSSDTIVVSERHAPNIFLGEDSTLCIDQTMTLDAYAEDALYLWQDGSNGQYYYVNNSGEYWVDVTNPCGQDNDSILALYIDAPTVDLGEDTLIYCPDALILKVHGEQAKYIWNDGINDSIRIVKNSGNYIVNVSNKCGQATDSILIEVKKCICKLFIPNSFTPNGDGLNDVFKIELACEVIDFNIIILNSWGEIIYESHDDNFTWNGISRTGHDAPQDTYVFKIALTYKKGSKVLKTTERGKVVLIK